MNTGYLRCAIREQIDRAGSLKAEIPDRQRHASLELLATWCRDMFAPMSNRARTGSAAVPPAGSGRTSMREENPRSHGEHR